LAGVVTHLIVLAAGMGQRIGNLTGDVPKVMLSLPSGRSLLAENLCNAFSSGAVRQATVITGHRADVVDREVASHEHAATVRTLHNPEYASAGPTRSLLQARDIIGGDDVLVINGDTYYRAPAFAELDAAGQRGLFLAYSRLHQDPDDVKVAVRTDGSLAKVGKRLTPEQSDGISAGMLLVRGDQPRALFAGVLDDFVADGRAMTRGVIWHDLVAEIATKDRSVTAVEIDPGWWREVDTPADYEALRASFR
jgi:choline kinase